MRGIWMLAVLVGCSAPEPEVEPDDSIGWLGEGLLNPFPSNLLVDETGHLDLPSDQFPGQGVTPFPLHRLSWRDGFSVAQVSVVRLKNVDDSGFPGWLTPEPGTGTVRLIDLTDGVQWPAMAELDAYPDAVDPMLIVRPQQAMPEGHEFAVAIHTDAVDRPDFFAELLSDAPPAGFAHRADEASERVADVAAITGWSEDEVALTWAFPIGDGTKPLRSALSLVEPLGGVDLPVVRNADDGDAVPELTYRQAEGRYSSVGVLIDDQQLDLQDDGSVLQVNEARPDLFVHIPASVADAPAGSVPVLLVGHGIFGRPQDLFTGSASNPFLRIAEEGGYIVVATRWRGLDYNDRATAIAAAGDFGSVNVVTDQLVQGQVNVHTLIAMVEDGSLFEDPVFQGRQGQVLPDPTRIRYYGVSMGGIMGALMLSKTDAIDAAVLHVGGSSWSTMLERSRNWQFFEDLMQISIPLPEDRQLLYAMSQLFWDQGDPIANTGDLQDKLILLQESYGDDSVPNIGTRMLARSIDLPQVGPQVQPIWGLDTEAAPVGPSARGVVQFDTELGVPPDANRPAPVLGTHDVGIAWDENVWQALDFLADDTLGTINHYCGDAPCTESNRQLGD